MTELGTSPEQRYSGSTILAWHFASFLVGIPHLLLECEASWRGVIYRSVRLQQKYPPEHKAHMASPSHPWTWAPFHPHSHLAIASTCCGRSSRSSDSHLSYRTLMVWEKLQRCRNGSQSNSQQIRCGRFPDEKCHMDGKKVPGGVIDSATLGTRNVHSCSDTASDVPAHALT
ncbi:uncharacterized protein K460DRAFT_49714 [Cucurbitaria berberidis CBS 394.84]|uniref:Uncharacterized protein n=1 Tax=Cucurbitaria berberidis CBS 394.84 TaxID=1168544 RepID=A0A9P4GKG2_9PLEO|nr:uncharacterized protein K460DRAFT_49714 [Cucurbitaria berberidis CBS 394.84]KAF1846897.1 hypothetical protein K460DRAFT_49714 [Cucurbitaria berberidis CBS 394.84]